VQDTSVTSSMLGWFRARIAYPIDSSCRKKVSIRSGVEIVLCVTCGSKLLKKHASDDGVTGVVYSVTIVVCVHARVD
jgi:hypothetical protein